MLLTGVCNTLLTKYQVRMILCQSSDVQELTVAKDMQCVAHCHSPDPNKRKTFEQPVIQTLQMFVGESGCWLVVLGSYLYTRLTKTSRPDDPAYQPLISEARDQEPDAIEQQEGETYDPTNIVAKPLASPALERQPAVERRPLVGWRVILLALPACCDIAGTTLMNVGLLFVAASIYQMTRGALVLFVGLFSVLFLKRHLSGWKWASLFIVVSGVAVVGLAGYIENSKPVEPESTLTSRAVTALVELGKRAADDIKTAAHDHSAAETVVGVLLIAGAQIFTATQFVVEESIMERYELDPIKVVGWEGLFGFLVTLILMGVLHGAVGMTEAGQGGYFDAREGFYEIFHNRQIAVSSLLIMISIG